MYTHVARARARSGNERVRQLVDVKHRHRRAYVAAAVRVLADYSVYLSMPLRGKQRRLSYFATGTDSFNKVQRGLCILGAVHYAAALAPPE